MSGNYIFVILLIAAAIIHVHSVPHGFGSQRVRRTPWTEELVHRGGIDVDRLWHRGNPSTHDRHHDNSGIYRATTFGRGHVITFDGRYYHMPEDIRATCPHILVRDSSEYMFMILRNSGSISLYTSNTVVTLHGNNKVEVNNTGYYRELPVRSWDNTVTITHDNKAVVIQTKTGLLVQCDLHHTECVYELRGNYYNHTVGLLGTNDNDISTDFLLRSGRITTNTQDFINHYELSGSAVCRLDGVVSQPCGSQTAGCRTLFENYKSSMSTCYDTVNPRPFMLACEYESARCNHDDDTEEGICDVVRAYVNMCNRHGVHVVLPTQCGKCDEHKFGTRWTDHTHKKLDIIIATSLNNQLLPGNGNLGTMVHDTLQSIVGYLRHHAGVQNVRVGLMAYGGNNHLAAPHVYTIQGQSFTRHYNTALWRDVVDSLETDGVQEVDPVDCIQATLNYPYRRDAVKLLLLFTDQPAGVQNIATLKDQLHAKGIIVNIITASQVTPHAYKTHGLYVREDLVDLAESTSGRVFDLESIATGDEIMLQYLSGEIHNEMRTNMYRCRHCSCDSGDIRAVCQQCNNHG